MIVLDAILFLLTFAVLLLSLVLLVECAAALLRAPSHTLRSSDIRPRIAVLVPARNEAATIAATLESLRRQLTRNDRLLVVADNCEDDTALVAGAAGAEVVERHDLSEQGKGHALSYGLQCVSDNPPDVVVVMDADCLFERGAVEDLARLSLETGRPVQATYVVAPATRPSLETHVSQLAFLIKNRVRPLGLRRLGFPCLLTGSGMAFPWHVIRPAALGTSDTAEDMQLTVQLALAGHAPVLCSDVVVVGRLHVERRAAQVQRARWEHGHLRTIIKLVPGLVRQAILRRQTSLLALALDLSVPPLSLLLLVQLVAGAGALAAHLLGTSPVPAYLSIAGALMVASAVSAAWWKFGRDEVPLSSLLAIPVYILRKVPLYLLLFSRPRGSWTVEPRKGMDEKRPPQSGK
jgi:cellulose synthase/poly-beta-1,6-N-acetylglucosamine synthase-like glycosyltransferase